MELYCNTLTMREREAVCFVSRMSECATRYLIDPAALGDVGRLVRCARCSHSWLERPPEDMPKQVDVLPPPEQVTPLPPGSIRYRDQTG